MTIPLYPSPPLHVGRVMGRVRVRHQDRGKSRGSWFSPNLIPFLYSLDGFLVWGRFSGLEYGSASLDCFSSQIFLVIHYTCFSVFDWESAFQPHQILGKWQAHISRSIMEGVQEERKKPGISNDPPDRWMLFRFNLVSNKNPSIIALLTIICRVP